MTIKYLFFMYCKEQREKKSVEHFLSSSLFTPVNPRWERLDEWVWAGRDSVVSWWSVCVGLRPEMEKLFMRAEERECRRASGWSIWLRLYANLEEKRDTPAHSLQTGRDICVWRIHSNFSDFVLFFFFKRIFCAVALLRGCEMLFALMSLTNVRRAREKCLHLVSTIFGLENRGDGKRRTTKQGIKINERLYPTVWWSWRSISSPNSIPLIRATAAIIVAPRLIAWLMAFCS